MPDQKLSQLAISSPATTPLTGNESVYLVQGGQQKATTTQAIANKAPGTDLTYDAATRTLTSSTGADAVLPEASAVAAGLESAADKAKLDAITVDRATLTVAPVRNNSGSSLAKGVPVYVTGSSGTAKTVAAADASVEATAANTLGLMLDTAANNSDGFVVTEGPLTGVNTSTLTEGQLVFLSETTGALTSTRPTQPAHGVVIGWCVKQAAGTAGILYVKVDNGLELDELHDVLIVNPSTGQVLRRAADGLWKNHTLAAADVGADPAGTASSAVAAHVAAADPHPDYLTPAEGNAVYAGINDARFHDAVTLGASVADVFALAMQVLTAGDPNADRILFWDDSAGKLTHLATDSALAIDGTTLRALSTLVIPLTGEATNLTVSTLLTIPWWPETRVLTSLPVWMVNTAPTGSTAQFDIRVGGVSIFTTLPTIDATEDTSATAAVAAVFTAAFVSGGQQIAQGARVTFHCTQIGATVAGAGAKVALPSRRAS